MSQRMILVIGLALMVLGIMGAVWSSIELTYGFVEIPRHWWSTLATAPLLIGAIIVFHRLRPGRGRSAGGR